MSGPSGRGPGSLRGDERSQSGTIGVALLLVLALAGSTAIVAFGAGALNDAQSESQLEKAEHSMTQFDSQVALVALGEASTRRVQFGDSAGSYSVEEDAGTIRIVHLNWDGTNDDGDNVSTGPGEADDVELYEGTLGAVVYENGGTSIAYQGGGVWRKDRDGDARMVSPPEFHYRSSTLTLPVVRVNGSSSGSGSPTARITSKEVSRDIYPNASDTYPTTSETFANPAQNGTLRVEVTSDYYRAWAQYFRERTDGTVTVYDSNQTVQVELVSTGITGSFSMPDEGSALPVQGVGDHSMSDFTFTLVPDDTDSAQFNNLQWSLYAEEDDTQLEIHLRKSGGSPPDTGPCEEDYVAATVYYSPSDGDSDDSDPYHGWHNDTAFHTECYDADGDGTDDEVRLVVDLVDDEDGDGDIEELDPGDPNLTYTSLSNSDTVHFSPTGSSVVDPVTIDGHSGAVGWEAKEFNASNGESTTVDRLINHYFSNMDRVELTVDDKNSNTITESKSSGNIQYTGGSQFITFLHVTENEVEVQFD